MAKGPEKTTRNLVPASYDSLIATIRSLVETARHSTTRSVNALMTATYWEIGRRIVEFEQGGRERAIYGAKLLSNLSEDLSARLGRGFSRDNLESMRLFYLAFPPVQISETLSRKSSGSHRPSLSEKAETASRITDVSEIAKVFPLSWSHYVHIVRHSRSPEAMLFYHEEALRSGWSVRQLDRQIASLFYERIALSKNKATMLARSAKATIDDSVTAKEEIKDPFVLEFLDLKDEYSESDLEDALIRHLEHFLLELGGDFAFIGRQKRLRVGGEWYRVDLIFFHRGLRCLVIVDLKLGKFTHADAGHPSAAWDYRLGNRSALEWILDQYKEKKPKDPTVREKFNTYRFADYKEKVIDLLMRVTTVSVRTVVVVEAMRKVAR